MELDRIYNMDCLEGMKSIPDGSVDAIITSPPYNYNLRIHEGKYTKRSINNQNKYGRMYHDALPMEEYFEWQKDCINEMLRISKSWVFYNIQMLTGNKVALCKLLGHFADKVKEIIIWDKINAEPAMHEGILNSMWEFIIVFDKKNAIARQFEGGANFKRGTLANMLRINKNTYKPDIKHSAMFPMQLPCTLIHYFTQKNATILDPFMGSGTTAIAALREHRHFIGFEINKEYYDKACERIRIEKSTPTLF